MSQVAPVKRLLWSEGLDEQSSSSAKEISSKTGIAQGTVDAKLQKFKKDGTLLSRGDSYEIAAQKIGATLDRLESYTAVN